jgi:hypothetical protein
MKLLTSLFLVAVFAPSVHAEQGDVEDRAEIQKWTAGHSATANAPSLPDQSKSKAMPVSVPAPKAASSPSNAGAKGF